MRRSVGIPWGEEPLELPLPQGWMLPHELRPHPNSSLGDFAGALKRALEEPIGRLPLHRQNLSGKRVVVVVDDPTRPTPVSRLFPAVLAQLLAAGIRKQDLSVLFALGVHRPLSGAEMWARLGIDATEEVAVVNHDCRDPEALAFVEYPAASAPAALNRQLVESDLAVLIGTIEPHLLAGFGGGLKNVIPGCAGLQSIAATHLHGEPEERFVALGKPPEACAVRLFLEEVALRAGPPYFLVNTVLSPDGRAAGFFCGDPVQAHREGCRLARRIYGTPIRSPADVAIVSSHPMDTDLRQGTKCLAAASTFVREGGVIVAVLRCREGVGDMPEPAPFLPPRHTGMFARELGVKRLVDLRERACGAMDPDERYLHEFLTELCRRRRLLVYAPGLPPDTGERWGSFELFDDPQALMRAAARLLPEAKQVCTLPLGGIVYGYDEQAGKGER